MTSGERNDFIRAVTLVNNLPRISVLWLAVAAGGFSTSGCGLVKAPFRVAGALTNAGYQGGKKVAKKSSDALERRRERKEQEQAVAEKKAAAEKPAVITGPSESLNQLANPPVEGPIIPLDDVGPTPSLPPD